MESVSSVIRDENTNRNLSEGKNLFLGKNFPVNFNFPKEKRLHKFLLLQFRQNLIFIR